MRAGNGLAGLVNMHMNLSIQSVTALAGKACANPLAVDELQLTGVIG